MSRRGAGSVRKVVELRESSALGAPVSTVARELLRLGLDAGQVCSLFTHAASALARRPDGLSREAWLHLCEELYDRGTLANAPELTSRGGAA